jgi:hypothetical protein
MLICGAHLPSYALERWQTHFQASSTDVDAVQLGIHHWFYMIQQGAPRTFAMPSKSIDFLWHELILNTKWYQTFCQEHIGFFIHHTTHEATIEPPPRADLYRTWFCACALEHIDPYHPQRLPVLFGLDRQLNLADGFLYSLSNEPSYLSPPTMG